MLMLTVFIVLGVSITGSLYISSCINILSFHVGNPEGIHELLHLFSDRGTPKSIRHMNAYSGHTYKFTKEVIC